MGLSKISQQALLCILLTWWSWAHSATERAAESFQVSAIAQSQDWLKLLHYERDKSSPSGWRSAIHSEGFFLDAEHGPMSPEAELVATLDAMRAPLASKSSADEHASCRFPARRQWLNRVLGESFRPIVPLCQQWLDWSRQDSIQGLSIVLATGYLGNPASYYGHTFLKFDFGNNRTSNLQDLTVNYGAIIETPDDPITYILKGVFGGYDGGFSDIAYHFHRAQYGENELRDLWEYQINLHPEEALFVAAHAWELLNKRYDYFFFRRNCAYRMAEIVEILYGVNLIPQNRPWTLPQATIQLAAQSVKPDGQPLVKDIRYVPSRQRRFYDSHRALGSAEREAVREIVLKQRPAGHPAYDQLPTAGKQAVLDALIDYHLFATTPEDKEAGRLHPMYSAALAERYALPPGKKVSHTLQPTAPHASRSASYAQIAATHSPTHGVQGQLRIRPAYYDSLDSDAAHVPYSALSMGDVTIQLGQGRARLHQLDLINIESTNPGVSGLPGDQGDAWRLRAGWEQQRPGCQNCLTARIQADKGIGRELSSEVHATVLAGGAWQPESAHHGWGFARVTGTVLWHPSERLRTRLQVERRFPIQAEAQPYWTGQLELRWVLLNEQDIRVSTDYDSERSGNRRWRLAWGAYW